MQKFFRFVSILCLFSLSIYSTAAAEENTIYKNPGLELADFINAATQDRAGHDAVMQKNKTSFALEPLMVMAMLTMYDMVDNPTGQNTSDIRQGKTSFMMLKDVDALREKNGDLIKFSGKKVYDKEAGVRKPGDTWTESGSLDMAKGLLSLETTVESNGKVVDRYIYEMASLPNGVWLVQFLHVRDDDAFANEEPKLLGFFARYDRAEYRHISASKPAPVDFTFTGLADKDDVTPDTLAEGFDVSEIVSIKDGQFTREK